MEIAIQKRSNSNLTQQNKKLVTTTNHQARKDHNNNVTNPNTTTTTTTNNTSIHQAINIVTNNANNNSNGSIKMGSLSPMDEIKIVIDEPRHLEEVDLLHNIPNGTAKYLLLLTDSSSASTTPSVSSHSVSLSSAASSPSTSTPTLPKHQRLNTLVQEVVSTRTPESTSQSSSQHLVLDNGNLTNTNNISDGGGELMGGYHSQQHHHHHHPHNHAHRHRHAHHHRNYHGHSSTYLSSDPNDLNESTDDPDSISIPVLQLNVNDDYFNFDHLKESNDYEDDDDQYDNINKNINNNNNNNNEVVVDVGSDTNTSLNSPELLLQQREPITLIKIEDLAPPDPSTLFSSSNRSSLNKSIRHHRSTPNLASLNDLNNINNSLNNGMTSDHSPLIITSADLNEIKTATAPPKSMNLLMANNFPSNLELSTNNDLLYSGDLTLLNNNHNNPKSIVSNLKLANKLNLLIINNNSNTLMQNVMLTANGKRLSQRYKLLIEGDVHVCKLPHSRNVISKILNSKLLRRWKAHRLVLNETEIYSTTQTDYMDNTIPYHTIVEVSPISKWEPGQKYCLRVATIECHYLIQTNNIYVRDQWIHSIIWKKHKFKSERVLRSAVRSEVLIKEIKNMIDMSLTTPIEDSEIYQYPLELVSEILQKHHLPKPTHEEVIVSLSPLLEKNHPSPEICDFFSRHCRDSPRSHIVIEMFSPVVQRILKHNGDFGRYPRMRLFVQDYLMALISQNDGLQTVQSFVRSMHSPSSQCPFPRVLPNFVSVCLAAIHGCFEQRKNYKNNNPPSVQLSEQEQEDQLICHTTMMLTMSKFEDWRVNLAQLLQSVPFPDQALTHEKFIKIFKKVVENFALDSRCEVHQTLLGIREGKEGWFEIFCPGGISCDDDGELFSIMLQTLMGCCCKKKRFLLGINKLLSQIMVLAVREVPCAIETLCAMLDLNGVENPDNKLQIISTLQSTQLGLKMYAKVCERQMQLRELQQKGGPRKLTLPSRSTDEDLAKLLLSGSFGNLECLSLAFTNVTSACAEYLIKLPSLRYLNLWSTKFGDDGLELISEHLQRLQVLNLCETPVTDKGLACLASMKQLRKLNLNSTNLSALTFEGLKECLPALQECDIRYTDAW